MIRIRAAAPADAPLIHAFIRELAEYERLLDEVTSTADDIAEILFAPAPRAFCDIAELDGAPVGFALWFYTVSTFEGRAGIFLEDLYVRPAARSKGAGLALMRRLARRCQDEGLPRLDWEVLDWNAPAIGFYDRLGARPRTGWLPRQLSGEALATLAG
jgi:GNAT superfamily N-acetyltransferase